MLFVVSGDLRAVTQTLVTRFDYHEYHNLGVLQQQSTRRKFEALNSNTLIKTTVRNKYLFVLDFIVHYYNMFRPRSVAIFRGRNML
jgi:hypothetical protein